MSLELKIDDGSPSTVLENLEGVTKEWEHEFNNHLCFDNKFGKCNLNYNYSLNPFGKKYEDRKKWEKRKYDGGCDDNTFTEFIETEILPTSSFRSPELNNIPKFSTFRSKDFNPYRNKENVEKFNLKIYRGQENFFKSDVKIYSEEIPKGLNDFQYILIFEVRFIMNPERFNDLRTLCLNKDRINIRIELKHVDGIFEEKKYTEEYVYKILTQRDLYELGYTKTFSENKMDSRTFGQVGQSTYKIST